MGHKTCVSGTKGGTGKSANAKDKNVKTVQESAEEHSMEEYNLFNMKSTNQHQPYMVMLEVNGKALVMEIDRGASFPLFQELLISDCGHKSA